MHTATLRTVGGSVCVILPRQLLRPLGLEPGSRVAVEVDGGRVGIRPVRANRRVTSGGAEKHTLPATL